MEYWIKSVLLLLRNRLSANIYKEEAILNGIILKIEW